MAHVHVDWLSCHARTLRRQLMGWWAQHGRHTLPWKQPGPDGLIPAYPVWVAEVMLQQTQVSVMLPFWFRWLEAFPDLSALARASEQQVLHCWQGLGYYARARRLHAVARQLTAAGKDLPDNRQSLEQLPGLGRTTAASILATVHNRREAILDGNVKRILARLLAFPEPPRRHLQQFWGFSEVLLDRSRPRDFNQALMDLGALVCLPRLPLCDRCPWQTRCAAYAAGTPQQFPMREAPAAIPHFVIGVGIVFNDKGQVLIDQRLPDGLLGGLWEFPGGKQEPGEAMEHTVAREILEEVNVKVAVGAELIRLNHAYSHRQLTFVVHLCRYRSGEARPLASQQVAWVRPEQLDDYPFPAANTRMIQALRHHLGRTAATA